jgi:Holliday junction resolvase RusA-like endonuclease
MYNDQEKIMEQMKWQIRTDFNNKPFTVPMDIDITFFFPVPKNTPRARTSEMLSNILRPMKRPDIDNCQKLILDIMNGVVYEDDAQVVKLSAEKRYGLEPKTVIKITPLLHTSLVQEVDNEDNQ